MRPRGAMRARWWRAARCCSTDGAASRAPSCTPATMSRSKLRRRSPRSSLTAEIHGRAALRGSRAHRREQARRRSMSSAEAGRARHRDECGGGAISRNCRDRRQADRGRIDSSPRQWNLGSADDRAHCRCVRDGAARDSLRRHQAEVSRAGVGKSEDAAATSTRRSRIIRRIRAG